MHRQTIKSMSSEGGAKVAAESGRACSPKNENRGGRCTFSNGRPLSVLAVSFFGWLKLQWNLVVGWGRTLDSTKPGWGCRCVNYMVSYVHSAYLAYQYVLTATMSVTLKSCTTQTKTYTSTVPTSRIDFHLATDRQTSGFAVLSTSFHIIFFCQMIYNILNLSKPQDLPKMGRFGIPLVHACNPLLVCFWLPAVLQLKFLFTLHSLLVAASGMDGRIPFRTPLANPLWIKGISQNPPMTHVKSNLGTVRHD